MTYKKLASLLIPGIIIFAVFGYFLFSSSQNSQLKELAGQPLAANDELYPVRFNPDGTIFLDKKRFTDAIDYLSNHPEQEKASADLLYLGQSNNIELQLNDDQIKKYRHLVSPTFYAEFKDVNKQKDELLNSYKRIVEGIGKTFKGTDIEILLHDTRDPIHSVTAIENPISGRKVGDNNSNFGVELIRLYSKSNAIPKNFVSYALKLKDGTSVKSSTIPLIDERFGLIGLLCMNINVSRFEEGKSNPEDMKHFVENFKEIIPNQTISELIDNTKRK